MSKKSEKTNNKNISALETAIAGLEKAYGKNVIAYQNVEVEKSSTGDLALDIAVGGGYGKGRIVEIYGPESSGKTSLALLAIAAIQKENPNAIAAFIDAEHALDVTYAQKLGVDISLDSADNITDYINKSRTLITQPNCGEDALEIAEKLIKSEQVDIVVIDSVAALTPRQEIDGEMGDSKMGLQARLMSQAMRKLNGIISKTNTIVIFINQIREKIGVMFGNPETTTGGNALKFYASIRLEIRKGKVIKNKDNEPIGNEVKIKVVKNKLAPPFRQIEADMLYGIGLDKYGEVVDLAVENNLIKKAGAWYSLPDGTKIAQGRTSAKDFLMDNPEVYDMLYQQIRDIYFPPIVNE
jgi:recombination protein RecA